MLRRFQFCRNSTRTEERQAQLKVPQNLINNRGPRKIFPSPRRKNGNHSHSAEGHIVLMENWHFVNKCYLVFDKNQSR